MVLTQLRQFDERWLKDHYWLKLNKNTPLIKDYERMWDLLRTKGRMDKLLFLQKQVVYGLPRPHIRLGDL